MSYKKRIPPIKIELTIQKFNCLINYLENINIEDSKKEAAIKLKNKLLRYSVPNIINNEERIVIRFFNQESAQLINILADFLNVEKCETNYYEILLSNRNKIKEGVDNVESINISGQISE